MFTIARIVCISLLSFHSPHTARFTHVQERPIAAPPSPPPIYFAPPPAPPTPIFIWINSGDHRNYGPRTDDYDGDGA